ncbi:hypothetical protein SAMN05444722_3691 [Rhodovulum sp. ES.010]|nr:hypothetical protein SAMN05444722_3691 [Rhodovulum sp. ES.010]
MPQVPGTAQAPAADADFGGVRFKAMAPADMSASLGELPMADSRPELVVALSTKGAPAEEWGAGPAAPRPVAPRVTTASERPVAPMAAPAEPTLIAALAAPPARATAAARPVAMPPEPGPEARARAGTRSPRHAAALRPELAPVPAFVGVTARPVPSEAPPVRSPAGDRPAVLFTGDGASAHLAPRAVRPAPVAAIMPPAVPAEASARGIRVAPLAAIARPDVARAPVVPGVATPMGLVRPARLDRPALAPVSPPMAPAAGERLAIALPGPEAPPFAAVRPVVPDGRLGSDHPLAGAAAVPPERLPPPVPPATVQLYVPSTVPEDTVSRIAGNLSAAGFDMREPARVGFDVARTNVRYYFRSDAEAAAALADRVDGIARDFSGANRRPPPGRLELWVAGDGTGAVRATPTARRAAGPTREQIAARLRQQVVQKLRAAGSQ